MFKNSIKVLTVAAAAAALVACGGGSDGAVEKVAENQVVRYQVGNVVTTGEDAKSVIPTGTFNFGDGTKTAGVKQLKNDGGKITVSDGPNTSAATVKAGSCVITATEKNVGELVKGTPKTFEICQVTLGGLNGQEVGLGNNVTATASIQLGVAAGGVADSYADKTHGSISVKITDKGVVKVDGKAAGRVRLTTGGSK